MHYTMDAMILKDGLEEILARCLYRLNNTKFSKYIHFFFNGIPLANSSISNTNFNPLLHEIMFISMK